MNSSDAFDPCKKTAVVLFQLGGPDSLEAVQPFLFNLFSDPDIINFPGAFFARKTLAKIISRLRVRAAAEKYAQIGGYSPITQFTLHQAAALESSLRLQQINVHVIAAMRYWYPTIEEAVKRVRSESFEQIILLPLYPQFSSATTQSSLNEWHRQWNTLSAPIPLRFVCCFPRHPFFLEGLRDNIENTFQKFKDIAQSDIDLVFSAHGVPVSFIRNGDPYQLQVEETMRCITKLGHWNSPAILCYQSKVGPVRWLQPSLRETVKSLAYKGRKHLLIVPLTFVSDHLETMHEINIEVRQYALHHGVRQIELMPALNDHPKFIQCLRELVLEQYAPPVPNHLCSYLQTGTRRPAPVHCPWYER